MITAVEIKNLRSIGHLQLPIGPLTVLVGENGAGKSSVIRGLQLVAAWARRLSTPDDTRLVEFDRRERAEWSGSTSMLFVPLYEWSRFFSDLPKDSVEVLARARSGYGRTGPLAPADTGGTEFEGDFGLRGDIGAFPGTSFHAKANQGTVAALISSIAVTKIAPADRVTWSPPAAEDYPYLDPWPEPYPTGIELSRPGLPLHLDYYWADFRASLDAISRSSPKSEQLRSLSRRLFSVDWSPTLENSRMAPMTRRTARRRATQPTEEDLKRFFELTFEEVVTATPMESKAVISVADQTEHIPASLFRSRTNQAFLQRVAANAYKIFRGDLGQMPGSAWSLLTKAYWVGQGKAPEILTPFDLESLGTRQFLPVMTHLLAADPGWTLITEEPEISLHPKVQVAIGELFADQVGQGKQLIFSTHSHYLLLGICKKVREGALKPGDVVVLDCRKGQNGTAFTRRRIDEEGKIEGWIPSFLEVDDYLFHEWFGTSRESKN